MAGGIVTRRGLMAGAALALSPVPAAACPAPRLSAAALSPAYLARYAAALAVAMRRVPHPALAVPASATDPWDRAVLRRFERALHEVDPALSVPCHDIGAPLPAAFADPASPLSAARSPEPLLWSIHAGIDRLWQDFEARAAAVPPGQSPVLWIGADRAEIRLRPCPMTVRHLA